VDQEVSAPEIKAAVAAAYDSAADSFASHADELVYRHLNRPLAEALSSVGGLVLDVAAGTGGLTRLLPDVVATDLSAAQLAANPARRRVRADAERLPFAADSFAAAASAFGVNHFPHPAQAVAELARVAPLVAVLTWSRPDTPYLPKDAVDGVLRRHAGATRSPTGVLVDRLTERVGNPSVLRDLLVAAGLRASARHVSVEVPWPGDEEFVAYRLGMYHTAGLVADPEAVRRDAVHAVGALPERARRWRPRLVLAIGHR
jgi:SAM-dependent methyltransferase